MSDQRTMTAPLAVIKVNGIAVGKMKDLRISETFRRGRIAGIGELTPSELPALEWNGTLTCDFYEIDFTKTGIPDSIKRIAPSLKDFVNNVLLQENGVDVVIFKRSKKSVDSSTGLIKTTLVPYATVRGCFLNREGMNISEGQVSGHNQEFSYMDPIMYSA